LPHSATKEFTDTHQAGAKPSLPSLERVKDANPDLLWDNPLEHQVSNGVVSVNNKEAKSGFEKRSRHTLDWWKCYLDSCASYHTFFIRKFLKNIGEDESTMSGNCNAGTVLLRQMVQELPSMAERTRDSQFAVHAYAGRGRVQSIYTH
jgi:hypothetical protein